MILLQIITAEYLLIKNITQMSDATLPLIRGRVIKPRFFGISNTPQIKHSSLKIYNL